MNMGTLGPDGQKMTLDLFDKDWPRGTGGLGREPEGRGWPKSCGKGWRGRPTEGAFCSGLYSTLLSITLPALVTMKQICIS